MKVRLLLRQIRNLIDDFDWAVMEVPPGSDKMSGCVYSIGFGAAFAFAEVLCIGIAPGEAKSLVNQLGARLEAAGTLPIGQEIQGLIPGCSVLLQPMQESEAAPMVAMAVAYYSYARSHGEIYPELSVVQAIVTKLH